MPVKFSIYKDYPSINLAHIKIVKIALMEYLLWRID